MKSSETLYEEARLGLEELGKDEINSWKQHPITRLLLKSLEGDLRYLYEVWIDGDYIRESVDATALTNAKMAGKTQSIISVIEWIETLGEGL